MKKLVSILLTLAVAVSLLVMPAVVNADSPSAVGFSTEGDGTAVWSDAASHSGSYSVLLTAANPDSAAVGIPIVPVWLWLADVEQLSFWYNSESYLPGTGTIVGPDMDLILLDGSHQHYLAGTGGAVDSGGAWWGADAISGAHLTPSGTDAIWWYGTWDGTDPATYVSVTSGSHITFADLKAALSDAVVLGVVVNLDPPSVDGSGSVYVDDITVNDVTYDLEPGGVVDMGTNVLVDSIQIDVSPSSLGFGDVYPEDCSPAKTLTIKNTGSVTVNLSASTESAFYNLCLDIQGSSVAGWFVPGLVEDAVHNAELKVCVPPNYPAGVQTGTLIIWARKA